MVTHTEGPTAMVLLDSTEKSIKVLVNNLTESLDTNSGLEQFGQYALHQAVLLTDNTVGMIVNISVEAATVLCNSGAPPFPSCFPSSVLYTWLLPVVLYAWLLPGLKCCHVPPVSGTWHVNISMKACSVT